MAYLGIRPSGVVLDLPSRVALLPDVETLHVDDGPGGHDELAVVALRDVAVTVPQEDGGRHGVGVVVQLVEALARRLDPVELAADAATFPRAVQRVLA